MERKDGVVIKSLDEAREVLKSGKINFPFNVIPSYVLEKDRNIPVWTEEEFDEVIRKALEISPIRQAFLETESLKVCLEDHEKAFARLAEINGVSVEEMKKRIKKISKDSLREIDILGSLSNEEIINRINAYQSNLMFHPLTCGKNSAHALLEPKEEDGKVILVCPTCGHKQKNWPTIVLGI